MHGKIPFASRRKRGTQLVGRRRFGVGFGRRTKTEGSKALQGHVKLEVNHGVPVEACASAQYA